jgi:hypothetical protein
MSRNKKQQVSPKVLSVEASEVNSIVSDEVDVISKLDQGRIENAEKTLSDAKKKLYEKVYAVKFDSKEQIEEFKEFMKNDAAWKEKEALGIIEICKILDGLKKGDIKDNVVFLNALPLEASHYFLSKRSGIGLEEAKKFISMIKPFEIALESAKNDAREVQNLEKELAAAQQGINLV